MGEQRTADREFSDELLRDARARLDMLHSSVRSFLCNKTLPSDIALKMGQPVASENPEITNILEQLVADGEALKRDNAELQNLLAESRSELRTLSEEMQEYRAAVSPIHRSAFLHRIFTL